MAKNNLLLVDLNDSKTKRLAEVITSSTSRKILNHLSEKEDTEAEIAKALGIAISTIHYHLQKLVEAKLVIVDEFHYSQKGREINHYKLANKYIIIAPKKVSGLRQALKNVLPVGLVVLGISIVIKFISGSVGSFKEAAPQALMRAETAIMDEAMLEAAPIVEPSLRSTPDIALWFLLGGFAAMIVYLVVMWVKSWKK